MTQQLINVGVSPNDSTGDPIRLAFQKINNNFSELYANLATSNIRLTGNTVTSTIGNINLQPTDGIVVIGENSQLLIANTAESTSSTTGSLLVSGGAGIVGKLFLGDDVHGQNAYFTNIDSTQIGVNTPSIGKFTSLSAATISGPQIGNAGALLTGILTTNSQPYVTSVGTISALSVGDIHMTTGIFWAGNGEAYGNGVLASYVLPPASNVILGGIKTGAGLTADGAGVLSVNAASSADIGGIKVGANLTITGAGVLDYSLPTASASTLGGFKVGANLSIDPVTGIMTGATPYASTSIPGVIKVGSGLSIDNTGTLNSTGYTLPKANATALGGIRVGTGLSIDGDGILSSTSGGNYTLPTANATVLGGVKIGYGLTINPTTSVLSANVLPIASGTILGAIRIGSGLTIDPNNGTVSTLASASSYTLPQATGSSLGGIKVGTGLIIDSSGTLSVSFSAVPTSNYNLPIANASSLGGVKVGSGLTIDAVSGILSAIPPAPGNYTLPVANASTLGGIKVGLNLTIDSTGTLNAATSNYGNINVASFLESYSGTLKAGVIIPSTGAANSNGIQFPFLSPGDSAWMKYYKVPLENSVGGDDTVLEIGVGNDPFGQGQDSIRLTSSSGIGINKYSPQAALDVNGDVRISEGLYVDEIFYSNGNAYISGSGGTSSIASSTVLGVIKVGDGLRIDSTSGLLSVTGSGASGYQLPIATTGLLGGVKIGSTLTIDGTGVLNVGNGFRGYTGSIGVQGPPGGYTGSAGFVGSQGYGGPPGYAGSKGDPAGYTGSYGDSGYTGSNGYSGSVGVGYTGSVSTVPGYTGSRGAGYAGSQGVPGEYAALGYSGSVGFSGSAGPPGGYTGSVGAGYTGSVGDVGPRGFAGSASTVVGYSGSQGDVGFTGSRGYLGYSGSVGPAGAQGPQGPAGAGSTYTLPVATASSLGGIKPGAGISVDPVTGVMTVSGSTGGSTGSLNIIGSTISGTSSDSGILIKGFHNTDVTISSDSFAQMQWVQNIQNTVNHRYAWFYLDTSGGHIQINDQDCTMWDFRNDGTTRFPEYIFPAGHGGRGQVLIDNGQGELTWGNVGEAVFGSGDAPIATTSTVGVVQIGDGISVTELGVISITNPYSNANVASYLPTYTGNLQVGNIRTLNTGAVYIGTGVFWSGNGAPYIPFGGADVETYLSTSTAITNIKSNNGILADYITTLQANTVQLGSNVSIIKANSGVLYDGITVLNANVVQLGSNVSIIKANSGVLYDGITLLNSNVVQLGSNISIIKSNSGVLYDSVTILNSNVVQLGSNISIIKSNSGVLYDSVNALWANAWFQTNSLSTLSGTVSSLTSNAGIQADLIASLQSAAYGDTDVANYLLGGTAGTIKASSFITTSGGQFKGYFNGAIGANAANSGAFTTITATTSISALNGAEVKGYLTGAIGANVANTGAFTSVTVTNTTASSSKTTGALTVSGGVGVAGRASVDSVYTTSGIFWANGTAYGSDSIYTNTNVQSYLPTHTGNVNASNLILTGDALWANGSPISYYNNINVGTYLPTHTGNVKAGNVLVTTGVYWSGNGAPFTNYSNTNVASYLPTYNGNVKAGNVTIDSTAGGIYWSNGLAYGSESIYSNTNAAAYLLTNTGNIQAGNLRTTNSIYTNTGIFWAGNLVPYNAPYAANTQVLFNNSGTTTGALYLSYNRATGNLYSNSTTQSSSTTTGAIVLDGGIGLLGNLNAGGYVSADRITTTNGVFYPNGNPYGQDETLIVALSNEIDPLTSGTGKMTVRIPYDVTLNGVPRAHLTAGSTSGSITIDIKVNGTSILNSTTKLTIDSGTGNKTSVSSGSQTNLITTSIAGDSEITYDVISAGSGAIGLKVTLYYRRNI